VAEGDLKQRLDVARQLLELFKPERVVYLAVTILALVILITSAIVMLSKDNSVITTTGLFGSSGAIAFTTGRVLLMWDRMFTALLGSETRKVEP
jgi:hypothetical protein